MTLTSRLLKIIPFGLTLLLTGCGHGMLNPKGIIAADQKHLLFTATLLMLIVVIPVYIMIFVFSHQYRASNKKAKYTPNWAHSTRLEIIWWGIPFIIILALSVITWVSSHKLDPYRPLASKTKTLTIQVVALNWKWLFIYPKQHIATVNFVQFPTHTPIRFLITADAPMNSFMIPQLAGQIYAMAGMKTQLHLMADVPGNYFGFSANYSGDGFSGMKFTAKATSKANFNQWVKTVKQSRQQLTLAIYNKLALDSQNNPAEYFSFVKPHLFHDIIAKYLTPKKQKPTLKTTSSH